MMRMMMNVKLKCEMCHEDGFWTYFTSNNCNCKDVQRHLCFEPITHESNLAYTDVNYLSTEEETLTVYTCYILAVFESNRLVKRQSRRRVGSLLP